MTCCRSFWLCQRDLTSSSALPYDESLWTFCTSHSHFRHFLRFTRPTLILIFVPFRWPWRHDGHATTAPNRIIVVWDPGALGESSKQFFIQYYNVLYNVLTKDKKSYPEKKTHRLTFMRWDFVKCRNEVRGCFNLRDSFFWAQTAQTCSEWNLRRCKAFAWKLGGLSLRRALEGQVVNSPRSCKACEAFCV